MFRRADPNMPEDKKLRYLMKGVKENMSAGLVWNPSTTVANFVAEASTMEKTLDTRARQYERPTQVLATNYTNVGTISPAALRNTIREVVRKELQKLLPQVAQPSGVFPHRYDPRRSAAGIGYIDAAGIAVTAECNNLHP